VAYRLALMHHPFHRAVEQVLDGWRTDRVAHQLVAIHSFTPALAGGPARPWHVGVVWRDPTLALPLLERLRAQPDLVVGDNDPYDGLQSCGYTIARHAEPFGTPALAIEVRQDQLSGPAGIECWARLIADCLVPVLASVPALMS
jgi:predicted N-formylglutamate amidohydrolase